MKNTAPALICLLLAACGGGGGGGGGSTGGGSTGSTPPPPTTTASYLVAGPIIGLEASGLVVSNGSENLTIPKTGTSFVFANKVATGSQYSVTIPTQPQGFQSCAVSGTFPAVMGTADVTLPVSCGDAPLTVSTLAGADTGGFADGTGAAARFNSAYNMAMDGAGNLYVTDQLNSRIRKITPDGVVSTYAGSTAYGNTDGPALSASFGFPASLAFDAAGNLYVTDSAKQNVRKITPAGIVSTLAGNGDPVTKDGTGLGASFKAPGGIAIDASGNLFVADALSHVIRKITPAGVVTTFAGMTDIAGSADGAANAATFNDPIGMAIDASGNLYVADAGNNKIRKITPAGVVSTFAGTGAAGATNGAGATATFKNPIGVMLDSEGFVYVADNGNKLVRKISPSGRVSTMAGGGTSTDVADSGTTAAFTFPSSIVFDKSKTLYVADNHKIRKLVRK